MILEEQGYRYSFEERDGFPYTGKYRSINFTRKTIEDDCDVFCQDRNTFLELLQIWNNKASGREQWFYVEQKR